MADVIVVGGGAAGLAAAIFARTGGAQVILLEKAAKLGGATNLCVGTYTASRSTYQIKKGIVDSPDAHIQDMNRVLGFSRHDNAIDGSGDNPPADNVELRRILADEAAATLDWLVSLGLTFAGPVTEPPNSAARMHTVLPNSEALIYFLEREAKRVGVDIQLNAGVDHLIVEMGRVTGVVASQGDSTCEFRARHAVILATGDFSASHKWKVRYNPAVSHIDGIASTSQGDGHVFGEELGAAIRFGDVVYGPNLRFEPPAKASVLLNLPPYTFITRFIRAALEVLPGWFLRPFMLSFLTTYLSPEPSLFREGAILVNSDGERFTDELDRPNYALATQRDKIGFIVFDDTVAKKFTSFPNFVSTAPGVAYAYFDDYRRTRPDLYHTGASLEQLAKSLRVDADKLRQAVEDRNNELAEKSGVANSPRFGRGPYHALGPVRSWIILSEGSLTVNADHQVVKGDGSAVAGLYAVGAVGQGGLLLPGHGTHLAWSFTSGRRAGTHTASLAQRDLHG
jgi:fumarate reductase flavoprotein subunit